MKTKDFHQQFVHWFRQSTPYIRGFRERTFVITFGGEVIAEGDVLAHLVHDLSLLASLGIQLVLVPGARPQVEQRLQARGLNFTYVNGIRVTDAAALECVKEAAGVVRVELEALLSMGLANSPMAGARIRVASGNFVTARPVGIRDGVDFMHTGEVRRVDAAGIRQRLGDGAIVLVPPLGYSPTGEVFNLSATEVATAVAVELKADKLIVLAERKDLQLRGRGQVRNMTLAEATELVRSGRKLSKETCAHFNHAIRACRGGVRRAHLIDRHRDGALLLELFTRDGIGTMVAADVYEGSRPANIDDVGGILELIEPLEKEGILVRRSREQLELEIDRFHVMERDGTIIGCAALYPFPEENIAELACLAVHPDYQKGGRGDALLHFIEGRARQLGIHRLFVLTTQTLHWFRERGFNSSEISALPVKKQEMYNYKRNSKALLKDLSGG